MISWIRTRYMDTPFLQAAFQVVVGGVLVFAGRHPHRQFVICRQFAATGHCARTISRISDPAMFTLAHLSDLHLALRPRPIELAGKRGLGFINWHRKRKYIHRVEVLDAIIRDLKARARPTTSR